MQIKSNFSKDPNLVVINLSLALYYLPVSFTFTKKHYKIIHNTNTYMKENMLLRLIYNDVDLTQRKSTYLLMSSECIDRLHIKRSAPKSEKGGLLPKFSVVNSMTMYVIKLPLEIPTL